jgi:hypothetical protein
MLALSIPLASVIGAIVAGALSGAASALLILAAGALLGAIALFWASVRTLSGDSPLPRDFATLGAERHGRGALVEEKRRVLRALKDLEQEHELGKIDETDYRSLVATYREQAKVVMRKLDVQVAPFREQAERMASEHLKKQGLPAVAERREETSAPEEGRIPCRACQASNEADAAFCKQCGAAMGREPSGAQV